MSHTRIRPARAHEAGALSRLALRSKAHWGYDRAFLDACRDDLLIESGRCDGVHLLLAEIDGSLAGFVEVTGAPPVGELANLWIDPPFMGAGLGRRLWETALDLARDLGYSALTIDSDPHAEPFYLHMGAVKIGEAPSTVTPSRMLPLLRIDLDPS